MWYGLIIASKGWPENVGVLAWHYWSNCEPSRVGGRIYPSQDLGTWEMESSFLLSVVCWPGLQNLLDYDPRPTNSESRGAGKNNLYVQLTPSVILMPTSFWRTADPEGGNLGSGSLGFLCLWLLRCYHLNHRTSLPLWSVGRSHVSALSLGTVCPGCWAGLLRGVSGHCSLETS